jgi:site-specific DNA-methyltransferase (adenine-specific)
VSRISALEQKHISGGVSVPQVRDLRGVIERDKAEIGVFLCFEQPTKPMLKEAAEAGFYKSADGTSYPRIQILTIQQLLNGQQPQYPLHRRPDASTNYTLPLTPADEPNK